MSSWSEVDFSDVNATYEWTMEYMKRNGWKCLPLLESDKRKTFEDAKPVEKVETWVDIVDSQERKRTKRTKVNPEHEHKWNVLYGVFTLARIEDNVVWMAWDHMHERIGETCQTAVQGYEASKDTDIISKTIPDEAIKLIDEKAARFNTIFDEVMVSIQKSAPKHRVPASSA